MSEKPGVRPFSLIALRTYSSAMICRSIWRRITGSVSPCMRSMAWNSSSDFKP